MKPRLAQAILAITAVGLVAGLVVLHVVGRTTSSGRFSGSVLYTDPEGHVARQFAEWRAQGRSDLIQELDPFVQPTATWFTGGNRDPYLQAKTLVEGAGKAGELPVMVAYNLPERDCGQYSSGGAKDTVAYLQWLGALTAGIGDKPAIVIVEPDAIAHAITGCAGSQSSVGRYALLKEAVTILKKQPHTVVYLDAGNASWVNDTSVLANALSQSGIAQADGFALNVANFETTGQSYGYGLSISSKVGGKHFVIDTSRNGAGSPATSGGNQQTAWCNPLSARLGQKPSTDSKLDRVDALLWIKQPGDSDGRCRIGDEAAGTFMFKYAEQLIGHSS